MTERKPPGVSFESWIDTQIRQAEERGEFDNLPGAGKPLPGLDRPHDELWWVRQKMQRENLSALPPTLAVRKAAEDAMAAVALARTEKQVRAIVADINEQIVEAIRRPQVGPPLNLMPFRVDRVVADWRANRPAPQPLPAPAPQVERRRWWRRRSAGGA